MNRGPSTTSTLTLSGSLSMVTGGCMDWAYAMLAYYKVLEDHVRAKDLIYGAWYGGGPTKEIFTPAILKAMSKSLREAEQRGDDFITRRRLAGIRKGFNLVLKALDVSAEDLNGD